MKRKELLNQAIGFVRDSYFNKIGPHTPDAEGYYGLHIFDDPIMGIASEDDPYWKELLRPEVIGPQFKCPNEWLDNARSVICFFLPISKQIKKYGTQSLKEVKKEWLFARTDAQWVIMSMCEYIGDILNGNGFDYVIPQNDSKYIIRSGYRHEPNEIHISDYALSNSDVYKDYKLEEKKEKPKSSFPVFNSNWSERHVGYVCGLGTFGLGANLITYAGTAGRLVSFVTDWEADEYDVRPYSDPFEYCIKCGACVNRCPGNSISLENGKDKMKCHDYYESIGYKYVPRYHCGTCLAGVPCQDGIPIKREKVEE